MGETRLLSSGLPDRIPFPSCGQAKRRQGMCPLRRVSDQQAGPGALGILLPPGERTVLIVRPRSLPLDLLLVQGAAGTAFRELTKTEAAGVALGFLTALESWNRGGPGH